eukprot:3941865-Rhodomonas_salina.2
MSPCTGLNANAGLIPRTGLILRTGDPDSEGRVSQVHPTLVSAKLRYQAPVKGGEISGCATPVKGGEIHSLQWSPGLRNLASREYDLTCAEDLQNKARRS